jgi:vacuolar iron transporter family protein
MTSPWQAALASFASFVVGAAVPLLGVVVSAQAWVTVLAVAVALVITGSVSARLGRAPVPRAVLRNVAGGLLAMAVTYLLGGLGGGLIPYPRGARRCAAAGGPDPTIMRCSA